MEQSNSPLETLALVLIGLGCLCTVLGTVGTALRVQGGGRLAVAGVLMLVAGGIGIMGERGPA